MQQPYHLASLALSRSQHVLHVPDWHGIRLDVPMGELLNDFEYVIDSHCSYSAVAANDDGSDLLVVSEVTLLGGMRAASDHESETYTSFVGTSPQHDGRQT